MSITFYDSRKNIMKRDTSSGSARLTAPKTSAYSGFIFVTNYTVPHNLGYPPQYRYYYEPFGDGVIYPQLTGRNSQFAINPNNVAQHGPGIIAWVDSTNLYIQIFYNNNSLTATYPVYWVIYKDFRLQQ